MGNTIVVEEGLMFAWGCVDDFAPFLEAEISWAHSYYFVKTRVFLVIM